jgi:hypothetical protein
MGASGGDLSARIVTTADCSWSVTTNASWLRVEPPSGQGEAALAIHVSANEVTSSRTGEIDLNGVRVQMTQSAAPPPPPPPPPPVSNPESATSASADTGTHSNSCPGPVSVARAACSHADAGANANADADANACATGTRACSNSRPNTSALAVASRANPGSDAHTNPGSDTTIAGARTDAGRAKRNSVWSLGGVSHTVVHGERQSCEHRRRYEVHKGAM